MPVGAPDITGPVIRTPDQRLRVFISSTLGELAPERIAVRAAIERLHLAPVMFEDGARPHAPRTLYRAYLAQSQVFLGIYWQRYGWIAEGEDVSGLEDEYRLAGNRPRLLYIKEPAPQREERLGKLIEQFEAQDLASYKRFKSIDELVNLVGRDLALLLSERFEASTVPSAFPVPPITTPVPLTSTHGRQSEIKAVRDHLERGTRLLTLTGPGGVGKTRLAQAAAISLKEKYADGICFVPLETVISGGFIARVVVDRLGIRTEGNWSPEAALSHHLKERRILLVLDNLEQVEGVEPAIRQMLERSPRLQILATSRRALRVSGEQELPVLPLPVPDANSGAALSRQPAVELFLERARGVDVRFAPDEAAMSAIAEVCRRVDGLPLAIELAAARVRLLTPQAILERLHSGFDLLSSKSADLPARHQTLKATLDWSHELLSVSARSLLARLSVFEESFSLEAATAVCGGDSVNVLDDMTGLLESSLILPSGEPDNVEPRFHMLQTVRSYAADWLAISGDIDLIRRRFIAWYLQLSDRAAPFLCGPHQRDWAARFDAERANARAVVKTALDSGDIKSAVDFVWNVFVFYQIRDASAETRVWIRELAAARPALDKVTEARLHLMDTQDRAGSGDFDGADGILTAALDVFTEHDLRLETAVTLMVQSEVHLHLRSDHVAAEAVLQKSLQLFASVNHDWGVAKALISMSLLHWMGGNTEAATDCLKKSLVHSRAIANEPQIARALSILAVLGAPAGNNDVPLLREAAEIVVRGRYRTEAAVCLEALALSSRAAGREAEAHKAAMLSDSLRDQLQVRRPQPLTGALSAAGLLSQRRNSIADSHTDTTFAFLAEMLLRAEPGQSGQQK